MDIKIQSKLIKSINPKKVYEYEFNDIKEIKTGKDWIGTFISCRKQITNENGLILIKNFENPKEDHINKSKK